MKLFPKIVFRKSFILDVSQGSDYASVREKFRIKPQTNLEAVCNKRHVTRKDWTVAKL